MQVVKNKALILSKQENDVDLLANTLCAMVKKHFFSYYYYHPCMGPIEPHEIELKLVLIGLSLIVLD